VLCGVLPGHLMANGNGNANGEIVKQSPMVGNNETIRFD